MKEALNIFVLLLAVACNALGSTFTVNNTADPGNGTCDSAECTLREAIDAANANPGADLINFSIPGAGVHTIAPAGALPGITDAVTIDGYTQPGASANTLAMGNDAVLLIEIDGTSGELFGISLVADGNLIRGLVINRFPGNAVNVSSGGNVIEGNFIGTDAAGTTDLGNTFSGILVAGHGNLVGGPLPAARNLISGNGSAGVVIFCCDGNENAIQGNYIGTNRDGNSALPNEGDGINISGADNTIGGSFAGAGNVISANGEDGVAVRDQSASGNQIQGNLIGTDRSGNVVLGNSYGVSVTNAPNNTVGGTTAGARNIISGNNLSGLLLEGTTASGNVVQGNYIGTDIQGTSALGNSQAGNSQNGIRIADAPGNTIGGTSAGAGNVISGNPNGIVIVLPGAIGNQVLGNRIGTDATGAFPLANDYAGIILTDSAESIIGGPNGAGNIIAFNGFVGIQVDIENVPYTGSHIFGNSIFGHLGLGIDLVGGVEDGNGVTANDAGDTDVGPNNLQNYPVINQIAVAGGSRSVEGTLRSIPNLDYTLDFYSNSEVSPSGYGEGETYLGVLEVHTDAQGTADFSYPLEASALGKFITVTATDPDGNTSEFSLASEVVPSLSRILNLSTRLRVQSVDHTLIGGFIITGTDPKQVILRAIGPSLGQKGVPEPLVDPVLELHFPDDTVVTNDNWRDTQETEITATGIPPSADKESAVLATLDPGAYTAIVRGVAGGTGVSLVELYDLSGPTDSDLANISTCGSVETDDDVMIGGIIIGPGDAAEGTILLRAIGPSLADSGVANVLADPMLELHNGDGDLIGSNDDWKSSQQEAIEATGIPPHADKESALLAVLAPGNYTAIVAGVGGTTGVGLFEAYHLE